MTALEAFLNIQIPNDFIYLQEKNGKLYKLGKTQIEGTKVHFREKMTKVISQVLDNPEFENQHSELLSEICELYKVRKEIIHLKTYGDHPFSTIFKSVGLISDIDLKKSIELVTQYFNIVSPNYAI